MPRARLLLACGLAAWLALPAWPHHAPEQARQRDLAGWELAAFALTDQNGRAFTQERLRGRWTFLLLGDTATCGQACDAALQALTGLCQRLAPTQVLQDTQVLFVSLDPARDTPRRLRSYLAAYDRRFIGLTGPPATLRQLADDLGGNGAAPDHAGSLLLVGPDGVIRVEYLPPFDVPRLTAAYLRARLGRP